MYRFWPCWIPSRKASLLRLAPPWAEGPLVLHQAYKLCMQSDQAFLLFVSCFFFFFFFFFFNVSGLSLMLISTLWILQEEGKGEGEEKEREERGRWRREWRQEGCLPVLREQFFGSSLAHDRLCGAQNGLDDILFQPRRAARDVASSQSAHTFCSIFVFLFRGEVMVRNKRRKKKEIKRCMIIESNKKLQRLRLAIWRTRTVESSTLWAARQRAKSMCKLNVFND